MLLRGPNTPMLAACWYATLKAGAVAVCTVSMLRPREIVDIVGKAQIDLCLTDVRVAGDCELAVQSSGRLNCRVVRFNTEEPHSLEHLLRRKTDAFDNCELPPQMTSPIIAFTSGTTGTGKATMHFHRDLLVICDSFSANLLKPNKNHRAFTVVLPPWHLHTLSVGCFCFQHGLVRQLLSWSKDLRATCWTEFTDFGPRSV